MPRFSHLHVHTQYSLLDGASNIKALYKKSAALDMPALAITDHGNMFGVFEFVKEAWDDKNMIVTGKDDKGKDIKAPKVKPIVGCEFYVVADRHVRIFTKDLKDHRYHQVLLAKNAEGYRNLVKLTSLGYIEGLYGKYPRIDKKLIQQYHKGLIATTCCLGAHVPQAILTKSEEEAEKEFLWWLDLFGEDYFVEVQRHGIREQEKVNPVLLKFAQKHKVPVIATNDSHYTERSDYNAHDILLCINTGEKQATPGLDDFVNDDAAVKNRRFKFPNDQFYFKTPDEMAALFADLPESLANTDRIVDKVAVLNLKKDILLPNFPIPESFRKHELDTLNQWEYLRHLTMAGARQRYTEVTPDIEKRLDFELDVIRKMDFAGYFLIVSDFIKAGREKGVFIGPGRGSAAGSAVAYCIGITNIDPIKYNLLFERFLNPDRKSMPDIDTDFDDEGRQVVIDYVVEKYGKAQVAQIVTYGTMAAKSSISDVARVMDLPLPESRALTKMVPERPGVNLGRLLKAPMYKKEGEKSLEEKEGLNPDELENVKLLRSIYDGTDMRAGILREAERLEGSVRNTGIHAAGIIIAPKDLTELIPVATSKETNLWLTQIEGNSIEEAGVIKMDFLGLKTLSIIKTALEIIRRNRGVEIVIDDVPLDDPATFQLYQKGETNATFQFESPGMQKYLRELKPDKFDDLIAMNALYRPGPLAYIPDFIERKHGRQKISYDLPEMEEYLLETYGITVYQEQVMLLSQKLAGFTKGKADVLRKAMGKKQKEVLDKLKGEFMSGAAGMGHAAETLEKIWKDWEAFAQYAFNKSHSTCYAFVAYQTAYLKSHFPSEYMAAVLNHAGSIEKITFFMEECKRMGLRVLGPDVNESQKGFSVNAKGEIRFGLGGLKGAGDAALDSLLAERKRSGPFKDVFDMSVRLHGTGFNKKSWEALVHSGALDSFDAYHRAQYFHLAEGERSNGLEKIIGYGQLMQMVTTGSSNTLFGDLPASMDIPLPKLLPCPQWPLSEKLDHEKETTGMFMSGHPLDSYRFEMRYLGFKQLSEFNEVKESTTLQQASLGKPVKLAGFITGHQVRVTKTDRQFGILTIEDFSGKTELAVFGNEYQKFKVFMEVGKSICIDGQWRAPYKEGGNCDFKIIDVCLLESVLSQATKQLDITMPPSVVDRSLIAFLESNIRSNLGGPATLKFKLHDELEGVSVTLVHRKGYRMNYDMAEYVMNHPDLIVRVGTE